MTLLSRGVAGASSAGDPLFYLGEKDKSNHVIRRRGGESRFTAAEGFVMMNKGFHQEISGESE